MSAPNQPNSAKTAPKSLQSDASDDITVLDFQEECLVINKPGGLLTQAPPGIPSVESWARQFFRSLQPTANYVGVAHRLDRPASGILLIGQNKQVTRKLASQFEKRTIKKTYWALVHLPGDHTSDESGTWTDWMRKVPNKPMSEICEQEDTDAKNAILHFQLVGKTEEVGLLQIQLETGRTHQIRLQCSSRGHAILGDHQYGSPTPFGPETSDERKKWIALHAREIDFWHPRLHQPTVITAPVPEFWVPYLNAMKIEH